MEDRDLSDEEAKQLLDQLLTKVASQSEARQQAEGSDRVEAVPARAAPPKPVAAEALPSIGRPRRKRGQASGAK
ncbi:MAG: hypothetical protein HY791_29205 [Deltaproteobacteria bacterium]|nr:hypothetical protein [Deltaproteobacteria bacterium]